MNTKRAAFKLFSAEMLLTALHFLPSLYQSSFRIAKGISGVKFFALINLHLFALKRDHADMVTAMVTSSILQQGRWDG